MRALLLTSLSAALLAGCLTTQENPNYEFSSRYQGETAATHQYATTTEVPAAQSVAVTYETPAIAPTDSAYASHDVSGTPGYMAMQADRQATAEANAHAYAAPQTPVSQARTTTQIATAGTPIDYDHSRNLIVAETAVAPSQFSDNVRVMSGSGQSYTVEPGDTVYSLSRKTCVGVKVIQSMNNLPADYGIKIGQTLRLPAPVC